jgi:hypothetical protein
MAGFLERRRERKDAQRQQREVRERAEQEVFTYADTALADDLVTEEEEDHLATLIERVTGPTPIGPDSKFFDIGRRVRIAAANAGRLPEIEPQHLISKKGEVTHIELNATLQKEVTLSHREYKGGGAGVSVRVAKGVRVRTGGGRGVGYTVIDGTQMQTEDEGILAVSSQRLVFLGSRKTIEVSYTKLAGLTVYTDGFTVSASNRQRTMMFVGFDGPVVAAYINAAGSELASRDSEARV